MFINTILLANIFTWIAHTLFFLGLLPQIVLNYRLKSTKGLSDLLLIGYFNGYVSYLYYTFCLDLPLAYKVILPMATIAMMIMIFQRFLYLDKLTKKDKSLLAFYLFNFLFVISLIPLATKYPIYVGHFFGWLMMFIWATYQIPQVFKVFIDKSVVGFSFALVSSIGFGDLVELIAAITLKLPMPTLLNDFRGVFIYLVFCVQFWMYKNK